MHVEDKENTELIAVGRKTRDYFKNRQYHIAGEYIGISERPHYSHGLKVLLNIQMVK